MSIFKACDIRGVAGDELDTHHAHRIGRGLGQMLRRRRETTICVGGDFRRSTPTLKAALIDGLIRTGCMVIDVGQVPTPVSYFAARHRGIANVAIVTASHNPARYNGVKFMLAHRPATPELVAELQHCLHDETPADSAGGVRTWNPLPVYAPWVRQQARALAGAGPRPLRLMIDCMNGAFSGIAAEILRQEGHHVVALADAVDPDFAARTPNPAVDANLRELVTRAVAESADLGIAIDGDGDRLVLVGDAGTIARPEQLGAWLIGSLFPRPTVVYDQKCASILATAAMAVGGLAIMQPSGHGFIKSAMIDRHADVGVEVSGHIFYGVLHGGDDALFSALLLARLLGAGEVSLETRLRTVGWPAITPDLRLPFDGNAGDLLDRIAAACGGRVSRLDGVRAEYADGWALVRASITEPALTLRFEARAAARLPVVAGRFLDAAPAMRDRILAQLDTEPGG